MTAISSGALEEDFAEVLEPYAERALTFLNPETAHCWALPARFMCVVTRLGLGHARVKVGENDTENTASNNRGKTANIFCVENPAMVSTFGIMQFLSTAKLLSLHKSTTNASSGGNTSTSTEPVIDDISGLNVDISPAEITPDVLAATYAAAVEPVRDTLAALPSIIAAYDARVARLITRLCGAIEGFNNSIMKNNNDSGSMENRVPLQFSSTHGLHQRQKPCLKSVPPLSTSFEWGLSVGAPLTIAACSRHGLLTNLVHRVPVAFIMGHGTHKPLDPYTVPYLLPPRSGTCGADNSTAAGRRAVARALETLLVAATKLEPVRKKHLFRILTTDGSLLP